MPLPDHARSSLSGLARRAMMLLSYARTTTTWPRGSMSDLTLPAAGPRIWTASIEQFFKADTERVSCFSVVSVTTDDLRTLLYW